MDVFDLDMNIGPTESPPSELTTSSYESQTAIVNRKCYACNIYV